MKYAPIILSLSFVACSIDPDYDGLTQSNGIDLSVQVGQGLTLPLGSFDRIYLTELIDTASVSQLQADDAGQFFISEWGTFAPSTYSVDPLSVHVQPTIEKGTFVFALRQDLLPFWSSELLDGLPVGHDFSRYSDLSVTFEQHDIDFTGNTNFDLHQDSIDATLVSLSRLSPSSPVVVSFTMNISDIPTVKKDIHFHDFQLLVPEYLVVSEESAPGVIPLRERHWSGSEASSLQWTEQFTVTGIDYTRAGGEPLQVNGVLDSHGRLNITGRVDLTNVTLTGADLMVGRDAEGNKCITLKQPYVVGIHPEVTVPEFQISQITGRFQPQIDAIHTSLDIDLGDDIDFLIRPDVSLDLADPQVLIRLHNTSPVRIFADIQLEADNGRKVRFQHIDIHDAQQTGNVSVRLNAANVSEGDLHTFLSPIPQQVSVHIYPEADSQHDYTFTLGQPVQVDGTYEVHVPLAFRQLSFCYEELTDDLLGSDRDDILKTLTSLGQLRLELQASSTLPVGMSLEVLGIPYGKEEAADADPSLVSCQVSGMLSPGSLDHPVSTTLQAELSVRDLSRLGRLLIRLRGQGADCDFNANQYLKIDRATLQLTQGVELNLND